MRDATTKVPAFIQPKILSLMFADPGIKPGIQRDPHSSISLCLQSQAIRKLRCWRSSLRRGCVDMGHWNGKTPRV
jgi:hypothetical protein